MPHKVDEHLDASEDMKALLGVLTLDEKISLLSAKNIWETPEIERVGIPSLKVNILLQYFYRIRTKNNHRLQMDQMAREEASSLTGRQLHAFLHASLLLRPSIAHSPVK